MKEKLFFEVEKTRSLHLNRVSLVASDGLNILVNILHMIKSAVIGSQHCYYNEAFLSKLGKKREEICFLKKGKHVLSSYILYVLLLSTVLIS